MNTRPSLLMVEWLLSDTCNLKCGLCPPQRIQQRLSGEDVLKFAQNLVDLEIFTVVLSGKEPLLHPQIYDVIHILTEGSVEVVLFTNGTLVDGTAVKKLEESRVSAVQISIDGKDKTTHDSIKRVKGAFKKSMGGVKRLLASQVPTGACTTVFKKNVDQIADIAFMLSKVGVKTYSIRWCMPCSRTEAYGERAPSPEQWHNILSAFFDLRERIGSDMEFISLDALLVPMGSPKPESPKGVFEGCGVARTECAVQPDGTVIPCAYIEEPAGNIKETSFQKIWETSPVFGKYRSRETMITGKCRTCAWASECGGGCKARSLEVYNDISRPDPLCWVNP